MSLSDWGHSKAIPDCETLILPVLKLFATRGRNVSECLTSIKQQVSIAAE